MKQLDFIHEANNRNIILFIHGFTGGEGTWNREDMPSFPELLRDERQIAINFDIAKINYYTKLASFERFKNTYYGIKRALGFSSSVAYKNLGIKELSASLKSIIDNYCYRYENIFIVAHSMGELLQNRIW
ncbi:alpha/beta hydrolase [Paenibacillus polymyxa]|uniref:alpha/beta hydrolase n=1 Tax=Paenibacillus polymyxa TaxID=1406 RepID=UPI0004DF9EA2|nr:alpha/beta hydrolase [Paenibacillus polymyxa]